MIHLNELRQKSPEELRKLAAEQRAEIRDLRFKISSRQYTKVRNIRNLKHGLAQILTILNQKNV